MAPPTLTTIPRELRQHILEYVFADMMEKDLKFNFRPLVRRPADLH